MTPDTVFFVGLGPAFLLGWWVRGLFEKGRMMATHHYTPSGIFDWFSHGSRLVGLVVVTVVIALIALLYTFTSNQSGESRDKRTLDCLTSFVQESAKTNGPRATASAAASSALRDYERGYSKDEPSLNKAELKARYLVLFDQYERVQVSNPPLLDIRKYCERLSK